MDSADYPALYQAADESSGRGQQRHKRLVAVELSLVVLGAALAWLSTLVPELIHASGTRPILTVAGGVMLFGALALRLANRAAHHDVDWFDGRAVAETVKSQAWRYMMRVPPYDGQVADARFGRDLVAVLRARPSLRQVVRTFGSRAGQISQRMRSIRGLPVEGRRDIYVRDRLADQIDWYRERTEANQSAAVRWFWVTLLAELAAVASALLSAVTVTLDASIVGVFASLAAAFAAWHQLGRHDELAQSYALAFQELLVIADAAETVKSEDRLAMLVADAEGAISREHTMWTAKRSVPLDVERPSPSPRVEHDATPNEVAGALPGDAERTRIAADTTVHDGGH